MIYDLNHDITQAALSSYKEQWNHINLMKVFEKIVQNSDFTFDWESGVENWGIFFHKTKSIGMLCENIPFAITDNDTLLMRIYQEFPWILTKKINDFQNDKVLLNKYVCQLAIQPTSNISQEPIYLRDFYVSTV